MVQYAFAEGTEVHPAVVAEQWSYSVTGSALAEMLAFVAVKVVLPRMDLDPEVAIPDQIENCSY